MTEHFIPANVPPMALEKYLRRAWPLLPGRVLRDALRKRDVRVNGARSGGEVTVRGGDVLNVYIADAYLTGDLVYDVDVLSEPEPIDSPKQLDVKRYGVIVSSADGHRRGLLLPDLDGIDTVEEQISIARRKGGISPDEKVKLQRFEVTRHE